MAKFGDSRPRNYFKISDLKEGDSIFFVNGGQWVQKDFSLKKDGSETRMVYVAEVSLNGIPEAKELTINATSGKALAEKWGAEGDGWTQKKARVTFVDMMSFGKMQKVLRLVPEV